MNAYQHRDQLLQQLGYRSYQDYLASPLWSRLRQVVLWRDRCCVLCGRRPTQVHHAAYTLPVLLGQDLTLLHALCQRCHYTIEYTRKGRKRTLDQVAVAFHCQRRRKLRLFLRKSRRRYR